MATRQQDGEAAVADVKMGCKKTNGNGGDRREGERCGCSRQQPGKRPSPNGQKAVLTTYEIRVVTLATEKNV